MTDEAELELEKEGIWGGAVCGALGGEHRQITGQKIVGQNWLWTVPPPPLQPPYPQPPPPAAGLGLGGSLSSHRLPFRLLLQLQMLSDYLRPL